MKYKNQIKTGDNGYLKEQISRFTPPLATYRLQLHYGFTLKDVAGILPYLKNLGIDTVYVSPIFKARSKSLHGYDITDHSLINPEIGSQNDFSDFVRQLKDNGIGLLIDVVPNHMCIADSENKWWMDVLENGPSSPYARYFDIDWHPPKEELENKVLLPFLGDQYGRVLDNGEIKMIYSNGGFWASYYDFRLPLAPKSWLHIFDVFAPNVQLDPDMKIEDKVEFESIMTAIHHLPEQTDLTEEKVKERLREKEVIKSRLAKLSDGSAAFERSLQEALVKINGTKGAPRSFELLEKILGKQAYRLCFWRVAADEINYRRFFDINDLAAIRVEDDEVFKEVHKLIFSVMKNGVVAGLRIDHVDGLLDPEKYLKELKKNCDQLDADASSGGMGGGRSPLPVFVEKILCAGERLNGNWEISGSTGYDFLNLLNGLFVDPRSEKTFLRMYGKATGVNAEITDLLVICKKLIMLVSNASELRVLAVRLDKISEQHRWSRDFTQESLKFALREVIACFPVYRTYIRPGQETVSQNDRQLIISAIKEAKRRNPSTSNAVFDFIASVLLLEDPDGLTEEQIKERRDFVLRFQQMTGPIMAKGLEDTAFYRYFPLSSLNEVGGDPERFGVNPGAYHRAMKSRRREWPASLSATSTHDTKRSEDVRARLNVLSEIPDEWFQAVKRWGKANAAHKTSVDGKPAPDRNEEYLIYQTLLGTWPTKGMSDDERHPYEERMQAFVKKALREAKVHTSWVRPYEEYESAVLSFISKILRPDAPNAFLPDFLAFSTLTSKAGLFNSLSQVVLKVTSPGVPDFYQGTELLEFSLVDPDNRRPVDYERRTLLLNQIAERIKRTPDSYVREMLEEMDGEKLKLFTVWKTLGVRKKYRELFASGEYVPLVFKGSKRGNLIGFARERGTQSVVVIASRFFLSLDVERQLPIGEAVWEGTSVTLPLKTAAPAYRNVFTSEVIDLKNMEGRPLSLDKLMKGFPVVVLESI